MKPGARSTRADHLATTYEAASALIVKGRLAPGGRIIETDLVRQLKASRATVRTALERLHQEGLVTRQHGGRVRWFVSPLTKDDVSELAEIMAALESVAGRRAANLTRTERRLLVNRLRKINDELRDMSSEQPPNASRAAQLDGAFHRCITEAAAGPRLIALCNALKSQVARYVHTYMAFLAQTLSTSAGEHAAIIAALADGKPDAAEDAIVANWSRGAKRYVQVMETVGERGTW